MLRGPLPEVRRLLEDVDLLAMYIAAVFMEAWAVDDIVAVIYAGR